MVMSANLEAAILVKGYLQGVEAPAHIVYSMDAIILQLRSLAAAASMFTRPLGTEQNPIRYTAGTEKLEPLAKIDHIVEANKKVAQEVKCEPPARVAAPFETMDPFTGLIELDGTNIAFNPAIANTADAQLSSRDHHEDTPINVPTDTPINVPAAAIGSGKKARKPWSEEARAAARERALARIAAGTFGYRRERATPNTPAKTTMLGDGREWTQGELEDLVMYRSKNPPETWEFIAGELDRAAKQCSGKYGNLLRHKQIDQYRNHPVKTPGK
jgi:hypothetical protein